MMWGVSAPSPPRVLLARAVVQMSVNASARRCRAVRSALGVGAGGERGQGGQDLGAGDGVEHALDVHHALKRARGVKPPALVQPHLPPGGVVIVEQREFDLADEPAQVGRRVVAGEVDQHLFHLVGEHPLTQLGAGVDDRGRVLDRDRPVNQCGRGLNPLAQPGPGAHQQPGPAAVKTEPAAQPGGGGDEPVPGRGTHLVQVGQPAQQLRLGRAQRRPQLPHLGQPARHRGPGYVGLGQHRHRVQQRPHPGRPVRRRLPRTRTHVVNLSKHRPTCNHLRNNPQWI